MDKFLDALKRLATVSWRGESDGLRPSKNSGDALHRRRHRRRQRRRKPKRGRSAAVLPNRRALRLELMEERTLLSIDLQYYHVIFDSGTSPLASGALQQIAPLATSPPSSAKTPHQIRMAYGLEDASGNPLVKLGGIVGDGTGQTIAIIDAYDDPALVSSTAPNFNTSDLHLFDAQYGLTDPPQFLKLNQSGGTSYPSANSGWATEEALDVEWAHVLAPGANIVLFEANSNSDTDLFATVSEARTWPGVAGVPPASVVSMSWGSTGAEPQSDETTYDPYFTTPSGHVGMTFLASTGDNGNPGGYPALSPNVVAVGGTSLYLNSDNSYQSESAWSSGGGGQSSYEAEPTYQAGVQSSGKRPDSGCLLRRRSEHGRSRLRFVWLRRLGADWWHESLVPLLGRIGRRGRSVRRLTESRFFGRNLADLADALPSDFGRFS